MYLNLRLAGMALMLLFLIGNAESVKISDIRGFVPDPTWMAGAWMQQDGYKWSDEYWTPPRGGLMMGAARMGKGDVVQSFEHTRIMRTAGGSLVFIAQPGGAPPSEFPMVAHGSRDITFANPAHDYPQRIRYWREGKLLMAEISKFDGSSKIQWRYEPMGRGR